MFDELMGRAAAATGWPERAAMLFGASQSLLDSIQDDSDFARLSPQRDAENQARLALGDAGYAQWFAEGHSKSAADAVRCALDVGTRRPPHIAFSLAARACAPVPGSGSRPSIRADVDQD
jgi:hypothetical protein